jgi:hypothetical protein
VKFGRPRALTPHQRREAMERLANAKRKLMWLGASTYRRLRSAGWQRLAISREEWSPRKEKGDA